MKRVALAVLVLIAVIAAIVLQLRGADDASVDGDRGGPRSATRDGPRGAARDVATGTTARPAPDRRRHATEAVVDAKPAATVARRIEGTVVETPGNKPFADADVFVSRRRAPPPPDGFVDFERPGEPMFRTKAAVDGTFGVDVPDAGPWVVVARSPDHADATETADFGAPMRLELAAIVAFDVTVVAGKRDVPIPGAEIWVFEPRYKGVAQLVCVADEHGVVNLRMSKRDASFVVRAKGFAPSYESSMSSGRVVRLQPGCHVAGIVRDRAGHGIQGAVLRHMGTNTCVGLSGADGRFALDDLAPGLYAVEADGFARWTGELTWGDVDVVIELARLAFVSGVVLMPDGTPALGADVSGFGNTDASGAFHFTLGAGPQAIWAKGKPPNGRALDALNGVVRCEVPDGGSLEHVEIRLTPPAKSFVVLRIVDGARRPVTDIRSFVVGAGYVGREVRGDLVVMGVDRPPGVDVAVTLADYRSEGLRWSDVHATATTQASADSAATEIVLAPRREFTVDVIGPDGNALPESTQMDLMLGEKSAFRLVARVREARASATWTVDPAHRYVLTVGAKGFAAIRREVKTDEIAAGRATVRLEPGAVVHGRIVSPDARAAAGAWVALGSGVRGGDPFGRFEVSRGADGAFRFEHVAPGVWRLSVRWPQTVVVEREVDVGAVADFDVGDVVLPPAATLHGVVTRPDGRPCGGATAQYVLGADDAHTSQKIVTHEDGAFEIDVPSAAGGALVVARRGFGGAIVRLGGVDPAKSLAVRLAPEGKLDVRIRLPKPPAMTWGLHVLTPDGAVRWQPADTARMDDKLGFDERYVVSGLGPGAVVVEISSTQWTFTSNVSVVAGATTVVVVGPDR